MTVGHLDVSALCCCDVCEESSICVRFVGYEHYLGEDFLTGGISG